LKNIRKWWICIDLNNVVQRRMLNLAVPKIVVS